MSWRRRGCWQHLTHEALDGRIPSTSMCCTYALIYTDIHLGDDVHCYAERKSKTKDARRHNGKPSPRMKHSVNMYSKSCVPRSKIPGGRQTKSSKFRGFTRRAASSCQSALQEHASQAEPPASCAKHRRNSESCALCTDFKAAPIWRLQRASLPEVFCLESGGMKERMG